MSDVMYAAVSTGLIVTLALATGVLAHVNRAAGVPIPQLQVSAFLAAVLAGAFIYLLLAPHLGWWNVVTLVCTLLPLAAVWTLAMWSRRATAEQLRAAGQPRAPRFRLAEWILAPRHTFRVFRWGVLNDVDDPAEAKRGYMAERFGTED
jgi:hypothetical protein